MQEKVHIRRTVSTDMSTSVLMKTCFSFSELLPLWYKKEEYNISVYVAMETPHSHGSASHICTYMHDQTVQYICMCMYVVLHMYM